jgi:hypothetical protein
MPAKPKVRTIGLESRSRAAAYSAEADRGAPIVGPDGTVESGNRRVLAPRPVYSPNGPETKACRDWLAHFEIPIHSNGFPNGDYIS